MSKKMAFKSCVLAMLVGLAVLSIKPASATGIAQQDCNDWPDQGSQQRCKTKCKVITRGIEVGTGVGIKEAAITMPTSGIYLYACKPGDPDDQCCSKSIVCGDRRVWTALDDCPDPDDYDRYSGQQIQSEPVWRKTCYSRLNTPCNGYHNPTG